MEVKTVDANAIFRAGFTRCKDDTQTLILDVRSKKDFGKQHVALSYSIRLTAKGDTLLVGAQCLDRISGMLSVPLQLLCRPHPPPPPRPGEMPSTNIRRLPSAYVCDPRRITPKILTTRRGPETAGALLSGPVAHITAALQHNVA